MKNKIHLILLFYLTYSNINLAQTAEKRGSIKINKADYKYTAMYDDVYQRLLMKDGYGNIYDTAIAEFEMKSVVNGVINSLKGVGYTLTPQMRDVLRKSNENTVIMFENIKAKDPLGNIVPLPSFKYKMKTYEENKE
jgi:hypothetical protein